jgi:copper oxidase (laccase) domain-containing protein
MDPTLKLTNIFLDGPKIDIIAFGYKQGCNLSLKGTTKTTDLRKSHPDVQRALFSVPYIRTYYAPAPDGMTGLVCDKNELNTLIPVTEYTNLRRGVDADGVYGLKSSEAFVMSSADCTLIVVWARDRCGICHITVAHAGRNSLYNVSNPDRASVVDNIVSYMMSKGVWPAELKVWVGLSISAGPHFPHDVNDPRWPNNKKLVDYALSLGPDCVINNGTYQNPDYSKGWIDIKRIAKNQFIKLGTLPGNIKIDEVCTSTDKTCDRYDWHSQSRDKSGRNLVIVRVD